MKFLFSIFVPENQPANRALEVRKGDSENQNERSSPDVLWGVHLPESVLLARPKIALATLG